MAVYYNETYIDADYVYACDGGTYSSNLKTSTAFDYFPDDAAVDDAIYFGREREFKNVKFYIGTAFAATSVTFAWEYYDGSSWQTLSVTDGTNGFTSLGERIVSWDIPHLWDYGPSVNSAYVYWVRCRITAIDTPTEGGAQSTQKISIGNNVLRLTSSYSLSSLLSAISSGGFGDILYCPSGIESYTYKFSCSLQLDSGGQIADSYKTVIFKKEETPFLSTTSGTITFNKSLLIFNSKASVTWVAKNFYMYGTVNLDACVVYWARGGPGHSYFNFYCQGTFNMTTFVANVTDAEWIFYSSSSNLIMTDVEFETINVHPVPFNTPPQRLKVVGLHFNSSNASGTYYQLNNTGSITTAQSGGHIYLRDLVAFTFPSTISGTYHFHKQWFFGLRVIDRNFQPISGASVVATDYEGTTVINTTTDENGDITGLYLDERTYDSSGAWDKIGPLVDNPKTPHTVTISKDGYQTKTIKYTMDRKREEIEVLEPAVKLLMPMGERIYKNLKPADGQNKILWTEI